MEDISLGWEGPIWIEKKIMDKLSFRYSPNNETGY
jgi:hypothetical protein